MTLFVTAKDHRPLRGRWGIAGRPGCYVAPRERDHCRATSQNARRSTRYASNDLGPAECLAIGPDCLTFRIQPVDRPVFVVARIVHQHGAYRRQLEAAYSPASRAQIVFRGRAQHLVIGGIPLDADEPVSFGARNGYRPATAFRSSSVFSGWPVPGSSS